MNLKNLGKKSRMRSNAGTFFLPQQRGLFLGRFPPVNARGLQASSRVVLAGFGSLFLGLFFDVDAARWGDSSVPVCLARMGSKRVVFCGRCGAPGGGQSFRTWFGASLGLFWLMVGRGGGS